MTSAELVRLIDELLDGIISEDDFRRLENELQNSSDARRAYYRRQQLHSLLHVDAETLATAPNEPINPTNSIAPSVSSMLSVSSADDTKQKVGNRRRFSFTWLAAALLFATGIGWWMGRQQLSDPVVVQAGDSPAREEATSNGIALLTQLVDVRWNAAQQPLEIGDSLSPGRLRLDAGYAQIEFFCGATVIIEGPADLELKSPTLARVYQGQLRAQVPPAARGFTLEMNDMKVVDLGTEFGLRVLPGSSNVQVFDGEVELHPARGEKKLLSAGEGIQRLADGELKETPIQPEQFSDISSLESRADGQQNTRFQRWKNWSTALSGDKRLIARYDFSQDGRWNRKLSNTAQQFNSELDGAIVGATRVPGRWPQKSALEFKRPGDRVRVQIPGEFHSLTFACWVKIDSLDRWYNSLFLTDHYNQGEPHWQILDTGQLFFSVRHKADDLSGPAAKRKTHQPVLSPSFWKPSLSGRWLHVATTYDADAARTTHYLNGKSIHQDTIADELAVKTTRIGAASIGNWSIPTRPDAEFAIRNLNGSIDEFMIFAASLSADEIREIYDNGKP